MQNNYFYNFLSVLSLLFFTSSGLEAQVNVTVSVDMNAETVDPTGVHIVGGFNGWDPTATMMTETSPGSGIYETVINRPADDNIEYKILNGNDYAGEEPTSPCSYEYNGNRVFTVPMADTSIPTFVFGGCPAGVTRIPLTFRVDVAGLDASPGVYVVGEMTGFNDGGFTEMSPVSATVYAVTIMVPADLLKVNFKYAIGFGFGAGGAESTVPAPCANPVNSDRFYRFTGGVEETEVYFFNSCDISVSLPVELSLFEAAATDKSVLINWATALEEDVDFFHLERSADGVNFTTLEEVVAGRNGRAGSAYRVADDRPAPGINYYRLTTVDLDGTRHTEGVRTVTFRGTTGEGITLYPNPVADRLTVSFRGAANITVVDALGRTVHQAQAVDGFNWAGASELSSGQYYLRLETDTGIQQTSFIK